MLINVAHFALHLPKNRPPLHLKLNRHGKTMRNPGAAKHTLTSATWSTQQIFPCCFGYSKGSICNRCRWKDLQILPVSERCLNSVPASSVLWIRGPRGCRWKCWVFWGSGMTQTQLGTYLTWGGIKVAISAHQFWGRSLACSGFEHGKLDHTTYLHFTCKKGQCDGICVFPPARVSSGL